MWFRSAAVVFCSLILSNSVSGFEEEEEYCVFSISQLQEEESGTYQERKYAPDRGVDILHLKLDVTPNFRKRTVEGEATIKFKPIGLPLKELKLDAIDLTVNSVESPTVNLEYDATDEAILITFDRPIEPGIETTVTVRYEAEPKQGLRFKTPELGYPPEDEQCWSQGEAHEAPHWYPNFDYPNERFTSEMICRVPKEMTVLSNGTQMSEEIDEQTGQENLKISRRSTRTFPWDSIRLRLSLQRRRIPSMALLI